MSNEYEIDFKQLALIIKRQFFLILGITSLFVLLTSGYLVITKPKYTAEAVLFLDKRTIEKSRDSASNEKTGYDSQAIESEVGVLRSANVARHAIKILEDKGYLKDLANGNEQKKIDYVHEGLKTTREGETYLISIKYTAENSKTSADFANAFAQGYLMEQLNALSGMTTKTADWLEIKVEELRLASITAAQAVTDYRSEFNSRAQVSSSSRKNGETDENREFTLVELNTLEKEATTYKDLHDEYLEKFRLAKTQESFPITETRIITDALPPTSKSHPRPLLLLVASLILGGGLGGLIALVRENFDRSLRRAGQIKADLQSPFLGFLPNLATKNKNIFANSDADKSFDARCAHETMQVICNAIENKLSNISAPRVVGVTSLMKDAAQTTIATRLAKLAEGVGKVAFIKVGSHTEEDVVYKDDFSNDSFTTLYVHPGDETGFEGASKAQHSIKQLGNEYRYIIIDLPPLISKADFQSWSQVVQGLIIIGKWGQTLPNSLNFHLSENNVDRTRIIGIALEGADLKKMQSQYGHKFRV